jgi:hypothetical protein
MGPSPPPLYDGSHCWLVASSFPFPVAVPRGPVYLLASGLHLFPLGMGWM